MRCGSRNGRASSTLVPVSVVYHPARFCSREYVTNSVNNSARKKHARRSRATLGASLPSPRRKTARSFWIQRVRFVRTFGEAARDLARCAGCSITLHGLRDTHASLLGKAGVPLEVVSKRLGHSNIMVTAERYLDVTKTETPRRRAHLKGSSAKRLVILC